MSKEFQKSYYSAMKFSADGWKLFDTANTRHHFEATIKTLMELLMNLIIRMSNPFDILIVASTILQCTCAI